MSSKPQVRDLTEPILEALSKLPGSSEIVLGGYFVLRDYINYRETNDIGAWWKHRASSLTETSIRQSIESVCAENQLTFLERTFGETLSFELMRDNQKVFSFQIAVRSIALEEPIPSIWPPIMAETLRDNVGAKMNALVERGAPRDFTDIYQVVVNNLIPIGECWELWQRKNPGANIPSGMQKVDFHLSALSRRRPLEGIPDLQARESARVVRDWYRCEFLRK